MQHVTIELGCGTRAEHQKKKAAAFASVKGKDAVLVFTVGGVPTRCGR